MTNGLYILLLTVYDIKKDNPEQKVSEQEVSGQSSAQVASEQGGSQTAGSGQEHLFRSI